MWHSAHDFHRENENIGCLSNSSTLSPPITSHFPIPPLTSRHLSHSHSNIPYTSPPPFLSHLLHSSTTSTFPLLPQPHPSLFSPPITSFHMAISHSLGHAIFFQEPRSTSPLHINYHISTYKACIGHIQRPFMASRNQDGLTEVIGTV
jgi:hypothetical protein